VRWSGEDGRQYGCHPRLWQVWRELRGHDVGDFLGIETTIYLDNPYAVLARGPRRRPR